MAAAAYSSVRRCSTSSSGSDYVHAEAGTGGASRDNTRYVASPSSQPSSSAAATFSPLNFLSLAEPAFTPLSMDSELFSDREFQTDNKTMSNDGNTSLRTNYQDRDTSSSLAPTTRPSSGKTSYTALSGHEHEADSSTYNTTRPSSATRLNLTRESATATMQTPHSPSGATRAATALTPDKEADVSGARDVDATSTVTCTTQSHTQENKVYDTGAASLSEKGIFSGADVDVKNAAPFAKGRPRRGDRQEEEEDDGDGAATTADAISPINLNPRQRYAGSTPLSLDPLQVARGDSAATGTSATARTTPATPASTTLTGSDGDDRDSASANAFANASATDSPHPRSQSQSHSQSHSSPPRHASNNIQPIAPLALKTKNINRDTNYNSTLSPAAAPNTSSITSPSASNTNSSPSTVPSAPAAFTRRISTSSSRSNSSLISQIQESLQQKQQYHHHSRQSSGPNVVHPIPKPIVRTASDSNALSLQHPVPDLNCRSGAYSGNVAALEKTAERLSMTSSIEDAIRDLHGELKRSDSRRSSILAASVAASQSPIEEPSAQPGPLRVIPPVASIVELNNAARLGGYSPSGYVMSPNHSLTGRLRSGSKNSTGRPDIDVDTIMSRHGPGKGSARSARSGKPSLAEIAESEPVALTQRALDDADHAPIPAVADDDATIRRPNTYYEENGSSHHDMLGGQAGRQSSGLGLDFSGDSARRNSDDRPPTPRSTSTFDHANAFGDFDGVHCQPEDLERSEYDPREQHDFEYHEMALPPPPKAMPMPDIPEPQFEPPAPRRPPPRANQGRPQSYFDPMTGQEMLYYPARVPAMLNLPPKLSKKPKADVRNARHSKVLQAMGHPGFGKAEYLPQDPEAPPVRESKMWLPDPLAGHGMSTFGDEPEGQPSGGASLKEPVAESSAVNWPPVDSQVPTRQSEPLLSDEPVDDMPRPPPPAQQRRKSKMPRNSDLPPQLRASAFFEMPSTAPQIELKDGSASATLDSILDASANAPISAFTDHTFAGKLGSEVYGKKKNRKSAAPTVLLPEEQVARSQKKRGGVLPFANSANGSRANSMAAGNDENMALSDHPDGETRSKADGEDADGSSEEEEEDEFAHVLDGPPTTLLAELQLRKYHQKMRTQNPNRAIPTGMHSTLLELDAVAEAQKRHREKKKIALAWEDGAKDEVESSDEDEVPLGVLYANQAAVAELNRPLGLMERRDMEENEPLSARRARLQGQEPPRTLAKQRSGLTLNAGLSSLRLNHMPSAERIRPQEESDEEEEGETLAERMRRLRAKEESDPNSLPKARPVSHAFSTEMLTQFGNSAETKPEDKGKEKEAQTEEVEETLGQRRKRLQAEREAREQEMRLSGGPVEQEVPQLRKKHSLADVLATHPVRENPAMDEQRRRAQEERKVREQEAKLAAVRAQMPTSLDAPSVQRTGGYRGGAFNDGSGGGLIHQPAANNAGLGMSMGPVGFNRSSIALSNYGGLLQHQMQPHQPQPAFGGLVGHAGVTQMANKPMNGYGVYPAGGMGGMPAMNGMNPYGRGVGMPMQMQPMGAGMGMQQGMTPMQMQQMQMQMQPGQMQSIERWRQSVMY
ncbi:hypothetical protein CCHL11_09265 [Colletotrichum chlorophyti]|uniref:Uncharacterized protein n=1 Tax=Colletotrichum chlorophyti TaxID=708187 RepID=A0A1Q8RC70_9PEZI|nr:hypothetical protein CCHL11_09265 [Colletotrichum chlorophyti]